MKALRGKAALVLAAATLLAACKDHTVIDDVEGPCEGQTCSGHGQCSVLGGATAVCLCDAGYHSTSDGLTCEENVVGAECTGVDCNSGGVCAVTGGAPICVCGQGYHLPDGVTTTCVADGADPCAGQTCSGHGECAVVGQTAARCFCDLGYHEEGEIRCVADDGALPIDPLLPSDGPDDGAEPNPTPTGRPQGMPDIVSDGTGGFVVGWNEQTTPGSLAALEFHAQRFDASLARAWGDGGATWPSRYRDRLVGDGTGGALFATSPPGSLENPPLLMQRINATGAAAWGSGVQLAAAGINSGGIVPDGAGAFYAHANRDLLKLDDSGAQVWRRANVLQFQVDGPISSPLLMATADGVWALTTRYIGSGGNYSDVWLQRFDTAGTAQLGAGVTITSVTSGVADGAETALAVDAQPDGGVIVVWSYRMYASSSCGVELRAQRYSAAGAPLWAAPVTLRPEIVPVAGGTGVTVLAARPEGGVVVASAESPYGDVDIWLYGVDGDGATLLGEGALAVSAQLAQIPQQLVASADGSILLIWTDARGAMTDDSECNPDLNSLGGEDQSAQRFTIEAGGLVPGTPVALADTTGQQRQARVATIGPSRVAVAWTSTAELCEPITGWGTVRVQVLDLE